MRLSDLRSLKKKQVTYRDNTYTAYMMPEHNVCLLKTASYSGMLKVIRIDPDKPLGVTYDYYFSSEKDKNTPYQGYGSLGGDIAYDLLDGKIYILNITNDGIATNSDGEQVACSVRAWKEMASHEEAIAFRDVWANDLEARILSGDDIEMDERYAIRGERSRPIAEQLRAKYTETLTQCKETLNHLRFDSINDTVIFLDIDGVFNDINGMVIGGFNQNALSLLKQLCLITRAKIVLSSVWRGDFPTSNKLGDFFTHAGLRNFIIHGRDHRHTTSVGHDNPRGDRIKGYLEQHPNIKHYIIIDDDSDMLDEQMGHFINVDGETGFNGRNFIEAIELIGKQHGFDYTQHLHTFWP